MGQGVNVKEELNKTYIVTNLMTSVRSGIELDVINVSCITVVFTLLSMLLYQVLLYYAKLSLP
jgi:hypothetical protein